MVWTSTLIGYHFFFATDASFCYRKTYDGGVTWPTLVTISAATTHRAASAWYDKWTPGGTGLLIHLWAVDTTSDDVLYRTVDTANLDAVGTTRTVFVGATAATARSNMAMGVKTVNGFLYCAFSDDAVGTERGFRRSTDGGVTWSTDLSTTFVEAVGDECLLFPAANTGDGGDCLALYHDADVDELTMKLWDSDGASATESAVILTLAESVTDLTGQWGFDASIRHSDGKIICAAVSERDTVTADHRTFELNCTAPSTFTSTEKAAITTDIDDHYHPAVFIDQLTNHIYVAFNGLRDGLEVLGTTTKVYYTSSTDGGATWSAGSTAYMEGAAGVVVQVWTPLMGPRFYVVWRIGTTLLGNKVNSLVLGVDSPALVQGQEARYRYGQAVPTTPSPPYSVQ